MLLHSTRVATRPLHQARFSHISRGLARTMASSADRVVQTAEEAKKLLDAGYKYVDVRGPDEFAGGRVPGAVNVPLGATVLAGVQQKFPDADTKIIVGCQAGKRSTMAFEVIGPAYPNAINFTGSYGAWVAAGMPIEK